METETKYYIKLFTFESIAMILMLLAGYILGHYVIEDGKINARGIYFSNNDESNVENRLSDNYKSTEWVCIDIKRFSYAEAMEVCQHEVGHYIYKHETPKENYTREDSEEFAEKCEEILK